jgi:hypothetical protein
MTKKEFRTEKRAIDQEYQDKLFNLGQKYAASNNPYKVGDIIKDHSGEAEILEISVTYIPHSPLYQCYYICEDVKTKLARSIVQTSIIKTRS